MTTSSRQARDYSFGPFYDFLMKLFPQHRGPQGILDVRGLAKDLNLSVETIYQWLRKNTVTVAGAKNIMRLAEGRAEPKQFLSFLFDDEFFPQSK